MSIRRLAQAALIGACAVGLASCTSGGGLAIPGFEPQRTACAETTFSVYFAPDSNELPAEAEPILRQAVSAVEACRGQGGDLERATVRAHPNELATGAEATRSAHARTEAVVMALVRAGLPPEKVVGFDYRTPENEVTTIMRRQAEVVLEMR